MKTEKIVKYKERQRNVVKDKEREIKKNKEWQWKMRLGSCKDAERWKKIENYRQRERMIEKEEKERGKYKISEIDVEDWERKCMIKKDWKRWIKIEKDRE